MEPIGDADRQLVATAADTLRVYYEPGYHTTGAALRTADGEVYTAVSLKATTGAADVHAEPIALARAQLDGATEFDTVVAAQFRRDDDSSDETRVVSACGVCREVLLRQAPMLSIIVERDGSFVKRSLPELLPD